jgi:stringent starvation protein B
MTSTRPYLIRAFYDWIVDNNCTPHIVVNAGFEGVVVPREYVDNGQIVLNISMTAVQGLVLGDHALEFQGRFGGKINTIFAPVGSILAIYAKENGRGMVFAEEDAIDEEPPVKKAPLKEITTDTDNNDDKDGGGGKGGKGKGGRPHLTIVK